MKRFLSVWLPRWLIERRDRRTSRSRDQTSSRSSGRNRGRSNEAGPPADDGPLALPLALVAGSQQGLRITATNAAAEAAGIGVGCPLADARAICPALAVEEAEPAEDADALRRLALWCGRYSPWTAVQAPDGVALDITGCAHLFGGETALLADLADRLGTFGLTARLAVAETIGAAWAAARHGRDARAIVAPGQTRAVLAPLPIAALRLDEATVRELARVGLKRVGDVLDKPRAPLTARFGPLLLKRTNQALGREAESFPALTAPPVYRIGRRFAEPIVLLPDVERALHDLTAELALMLARAGKGARRLDLTFFRVDGQVAALTVRTSGLCKEADHAARLFRERLHEAGSGVDAGFGIEAMTLGAFDVEPVSMQQRVFRTGPGKNAADEGLHRLLDRFGNRFGFDNIVRFAPRPSHIPERACVPVPILQGAAAREQVPYDWQAHLHTVQGGRRLGRPLLLLAPPEPVAALAEVPEGPPVRFEWRRVSRRVVRADGPERLAPEWWGRRRRDAGQTRDYYRIEDDRGHRFWLFREGLYGRERDDPRWFIHGLFP